jgi:DNA excision repair protein ERCC-4
MSKSFRVVVDERERQSGIPELLKTLGLQVEYRMLETADYIVSSECAIERKQERDFLKSLYSGRLFDQIHRLCEVYSRPVLIVESEMPHIARQMAKPRVFWGTLATLMFQYGVNVFFTAETQQTADLIYTLATHRQFAKPKGPFIQKKLKTASLGKAQLSLVANLPSIGPKLADRALKKFGTVRKVFNASIAELSTVKGIGRKKSERICTVLDACYRPPEKVSRQLQLDREQAQPQDF